MSDAGVWPGPFEIEAIDPYPFHGLVYTEGSTEWLQPDGGRPPIQLPSRLGVPAPRPGPSYQPLANSSIWDVGCPDPPFSAALHAAGGKSLGRRLVESGSYLTQTSTGPRHLVLRHGEGDEIFIRDEPPGQILGPVLATTEIPMASVLAGVSMLIDTHTGNEFEADATFIDSLDSSLDGRKRLIGIRATYLSLGGTQALYIGFLVVEIHESEGGVFSLSVAVLKNALDCIGVTTYSRTQQLSWWRPMEAGEAIDPDRVIGTGVSSGLRIAAGRFEVQHSVTNTIIGAYFDGDQVRYFRASLSYREVRSTATEGSYFLPNGVEHWAVTRMLDVDSSATIFSDQGSVTLNYSRDSLSTLSMNYENGDAVGTYSQSATTTMTGLPPVEDSLDGVVDNRPGGDPGGGTMLDALGKVAISDTGPVVPGGMYAPRRIEIGHTSVLIGDFNGYARAEEADTRCNKTKGFALYQRGAHGEVPTHVSTTLTPDGPHGAIAAIPEGGVGTWPAWASYNPLTREVARSVDYPGKSLRGWL